jgi:hypothetical protein
MSFWSFWFSACKIAYSLCSLFISVKRSSSSIRSYFCSPLSLLSVSVLDMLIWIWSLSCISILYCSKFYMSKLYRMSASVLYCFFSDKSLFISTVIFCFSLTINLPNQRPSAQIATKTESNALIIHLQQSLALLHTQAEKHQHEKQ